jgi:precorrin-6x reductase
MSTVLILDKYKPLFKDEKAFQEFVQVLGGTGEAQALRLILLGEETVAALVSLDEAMERLRDRIVLRLAKSPGAIDLLKSRLQSEDIVE